MRDWATRVVLACERMTCRAIRRTKSPAAHERGSIPSNPQWRTDEVVAYLAFNLTRPSFDPKSDARFYYIYHSDARPLDIRTLDRNHIEIHTEGANYLHVFPVGAAGVLDLLAWGALQQGRWGFLDHRAWIYDVEAGWQPAKLPRVPWLRIGYGRSSGDDDPADGDHRTFFQLVPTAHIYAWSAFYNLENDEDGFVQLILRPIAGLMWRTDFHSIRLTEGRDLYYTGLVYDWNAHLSTIAYYGHLFGGGVIRSLFDRDDADFGYVEATVRL
jgi:hypothetical protein